MRHHVTANIFRTLQEPDTSRFLRDTLEKAVHLDEADALYDVEKAVELLRERAEVFLGKKVKED